MIFFWIKIFGCFFVRFRKKPKKKIKKTLIERTMSNQQTIVFSFLFSIWQITPVFINFNVMTWFNSIEWNKTLSIDGLQTTTQRCQSINTLLIDNIQRQCCVERFARRWWAVLCIVVRFSLRKRETNRRCFLYQLF